MRPPTSIGFASAYEDAVTSGYPLGNGYRWYLPALMRFNAPDGESPFGHGGVHPYTYCAADPVNRLDPTGHELLSALGLTPEETLEALNEMDAREALQRPFEPSAADASSAQPPASSHGGSGAPPSASGVGQLAQLPRSESIAAHQAGATATVAPPSRPLPAMYARVDVAPSATEHTPFSWVLSVAVPDTSQSRRISRARAIGIVRTIARFYPGWAITQLRGYSESALKAYLRTPSYEVLKTTIRKHVSRRRDKASIEWRMIAFYFGVDVGDIP